jgi:Holliday junction resolvase RusA-like endonuclease
MNLDPTAIDVMETRGDGVLSLDLFLPWTPRAQPRNRVNLNTRAIYNPASAVQRADAAKIGKAMHEMGLNRSPYFVPGVPVYMKALYIIPRRQVDFAVVDGEAFLVEGAQEMPLGVDVDNLTKYLMDVLQLAFIVGNDNVIAHGNNKKDFSEVVDERVGWTRVRLSQPIRPVLVAII